MNHGEIAWSDSLALGIPSVDLEHQAFIELVSKFIEKLEQGTSKVLVAPTLDRIVDTLHFHSRAEEERLQAHGFDDLIAHAREHRKMLSLLHSLRLEFMVADSAPEHANIARLVGQSVISHIDEHDRRCVQFLHDVGDQ